MERVCRQLRPSVLYRGSSQFEAAPYGRYWCVDEDAAEAFAHNIGISHNPTREPYACVMRGYLPSGALLVHAPWVFQQPVLLALKDIKLTVEQACLILMAVGVPEVRGEHAQSIVRAVWLSLHCYWHPTQDVPFACDIGPNVVGIDLSAIPGRSGVSIFVENSTRMFTAVEARCTDSSDPYVPIHSIAVQSEVLFNSHSQDVVRTIRKLGLQPAKCDQHTDPVVFIGRCILAKAKLWEKLENEHGELELCPGHVFIEYMECCLEYNYLRLPSADEWPTHVVWRTPAELAKKLVLFEEE